MHTTSPVHRPRARGREPRPCVRRSAGGPLAPLSFRLFGFPVVVLPQFLLLLGFYALVRIGAGSPAWEILSWWAVVSFSVLIHELGHALTCRAFGIPVHHIQLHGLGGEVSREPSGPGSSLLVSLAGPFAGITLGLLVLGLARTTGIAGSEVGDVITRQLLWVNLGWSVLNLLPMRPLDGGNALLSGLFLVVPRFAAPVTHGIGLLCALAFVALGVLWQEPFLLIFGGLAASVNAAALGLMRGRSSPR